MPVHYDPAKIRKRYCPQGHDKYEVGVKTSGQILGHQTARCYGCHLKSTNNGWSNPVRAIKERQRWIRNRRGRKIEQIKELLAQLEGEN